MTRVGQVIAATAMSLFVGIYSVESFAAEPDSIAVESKAVVAQLSETMVATPDASDAVSAVSVPVVSVGSVGSSAVSVSVGSSTSNSATTPATTSIKMPSTAQNALLMSSVGGYGEVYVAENALDAAARKERAEKAKKTKKNLGRVSGSFETNTIYYIDDPETKSIAPNPPIGSHNFLKIDYNIGKFSAGIQAEYYPYVLQGYQKELQGFGIPGKYIAWTDDWFSVTVGDFYEQFGSGLLFRAWEDRQLGINNSIGGARATFSVKDIFNAKLIYGFPRDYLHSIGRGYDFAGSLFNDYAPSQVYGGDVYLSLSNWFFPGLGHNLYLGGSVLNRFERYVPSRAETGLSEDVPQNVTGFSARLGYEYAGFSIRGEYVGRGKDLYLNPQTSKQELKAGNAQLVEVNYSGHGLSVSGTFRRLSNMQGVIYHDGQNSPLPGNTMNYLPSLTLQQSYMLASHNPYTPKVDGELGGAIDLFYVFKRGSAVGGKYGMKLHVNASMVYATPEALHASAGNRLAYRDITVNLEKTWTKKFKTTFFVSIQENSPSYGDYVATEAQNVFVVDMQYKFTPKFSLRAELQYLYSEERTRDWVAALLEVNFAPKWSVYVSDMYNHGSSKVHYYSVGASFTSGIWRVAANWGRNREGYVCSGGVCRWQPAYTGANLQLSITF